MKIAIVGAGISGSSALKAIMDHPNFKGEDEIHVFESRDLLGVGLPYRPDDESAMLNVSSDMVSVEEEDPLDFTKWLEENYEHPTNFEDLVSRPRYGQYLRERFEPYFDHPQVICFQTTVLDLQVLDGATKTKISESKKGHYAYRIQTAAGWRDDIYDGVFLAVGHPEYADYYDLTGAENYFSNPYPMKDKLSGFSNDQRIGIIGSGATGVDLMRFFATNYDLNHPLTFYVRERSFNFPDIPYEKDTFQFTFSMEWIEQERDKQAGIVPFDKILSTFIEDIKAGGVDPEAVYHQYRKKDLASMRAAVESKDQNLALIHAYTSQLVALIPHLYNSLSGQDRAFYRANYYGPLKFFKSRVPYKTFIWLFDLMDQGKVSVVRGLTEILPREQGGFDVNAETKETADILVNATGFESRLSEAGRSLPLIKNLYRQNIILPHLDGRFVLMDWPQAQVLNQKFGLMDTLFFFGLLMGGTQHENNDAQLTHQLAARAAAWFMDQRDV